MSHIPNSAMPTAAPRAEEKVQASEGRFGRISAMRSGVADKVREYPKTAAAAGTAVAAGLVAAAAIPAIRRRRADAKASA
ncbi:hypothetical protein [Sphingosinicella terrae]|uniref:hypothetical protein n=1 Tax=Sphingosinicella terrae TaxID=2172047 RepID=UPI000E0CC139|nr:hypothetical protein [Sphingosinicella terrae]